MGDKLPTLLTLLPAVLMVYGIMAGGFALRRFGGFPAAVDVPMTRMVVNIFFPAFIIANLLGQMPDSAGIAPVLGFGSTVVGMIISYALAPVFGLKSPRSRRAFALAAGFYNYGYLPLPLAEALAPAGLVHPDTLSAILVHNIGVEIAFWSIGFMLASGSFQADAWKRLLNAPLITFALVLTLNLSGGAAALADALPRLNAWVLETAGFLGGVAIPMSLLLTGAAIAEVFDEAGFRRGWPTISGAALLRLGLLPIMMIAAAYLLVPVAEGERSALRDALMIEAAMPAAMFSIVICRLFSADTVTAVRVVLGTTILSILTTPLWLMFAL